MTSAQNISNKYYTDDIHEIALPISALPDIGEAKVPVPFQYNTLENRMTEHFVKEADRYKVDTAYYKKELEGLKKYGAI